MKRVTLSDQQLNSALTKITSVVLDKMLDNLHWHDYLENSFELIIHLNQNFTPHIDIWKASIVSFFMGKRFFKMRNCCLEKWKIILPSIMLLDTFKTFSDSLLEPPSSSSFLFKDQGISEKTMLWKRVSFSMLVCPLDAFRYHLPDLQKALVESFKSFSDDLHAESFLFLRVLLVKVSPKHTAHFWAVILSAMVSFKF